MKAAKLFAGIVFFASTYAMAYPMVGDKVEWTGTVVGTDGTTTEVKGSKEVLSQDPTTMKWLVKSWVQMGKWERCETKEKKNLYSSEKWQEIMTNCVTRGGVMEEITVPAGTYNTCKMTKTGDDKGGHHGDDGDSVTMWWGDVPFGLVKVMKTDGDSGKVKTMELSTVTLGQ